MMSLKGVSSCQQSEGPVVFAGLDIEFEVVLPSCIWWYLN